MQAELVERARDGDKDAFASLVSSSIDGCYALAYRILRDPHRAQDATQQAMLGAWRDLPTLRDSRAFRRLASPPGRQCLLLGSPRRTSPRGPRAAAPNRPSHLAGRGALRRRARRPRPRLPPAVSGTAGGRRPSPPPRVPADGDRGHPWHPRRDRAVPSPLRGPSAADRARRQRSQPGDLRGATRMNRSTELDFDQRIADWLEDDPNLAPRQVIETVLAAYPSIPQRRRAPWRFPTMTLTFRLATAAVIGALVLGGAFLLTGGGSRPSTVRSDRRHRPPSLRRGRAPVRSAAHASTSRPPLWPTAGSSCPAGATPAAAWHQPRSMTRRRDMDRDGVDEPDSRDTHADPSRQRQGPGDRRSERCHARQRSSTTLRRARGRRPDPRPTPAVQEMAALLSDGRVLVAGGTRTANALPAEIYDPATGTWTQTGVHERVPRFVGDRRPVRWARACRGRVRLDSRRRRLDRDLRPADQDLDTDRVDGQHPGLRPDRHTLDRRPGPRDRWRRSDSRDLRPREGDVDRNGRDRDIGRRDRDLVA